MANLPNYTRFPCLRGRQLNLRPVPHLILLPAKRRPRGIPNSRQSRLPARLELPSSRINHPPPKSGNSPLRKSKEEVRLPPGQKAGVQEITSGPDVTAKAEKGISQEVDKEPLQADAETGKRLFIRVQACNVREEPSTASRVKFRLEMGDPVNMTGKRGRWVAVKLDDGRFGWVYHTLLTDSIVLQKAAPRATKKIKAIRPEIADKDIAKIIFELNGPFPPQTMIVEGEKPRVVCDFFDAGLAADIGKSIEVNSGIVEKIRTGIHKSPKFKVRVVLDLVPRRNYEVDQFFFEKENYYVLVVKAKE